MMRPRLQSVDLVYGCLEGHWSIPQGDRPVLITGPNGSGKSTLVDGIARVLFGFDRRRPAEADGHDAVRPWDREEMRGRVVLTRAGADYEIRRDFLTDRVRIVERVQGIDRFDGDGNPAARNQEAHHYRRLLTELFGLGTLDAYRRTLFVRQGELTDTALGEHLLRVAAGGHARVEQARREIGRAHRHVTRRPLYDGAAAAINPRELEQLEEEVAGVRARLTEAKGAAERRGPLTHERDMAVERLAVLDREIEILEDARSAFARSEAVKIGARRLREQVRELENAAAAIARAASELRAATTAHREATRTGRYPPDFPQRFARAEVRWRDLTELEGSTAPALMGAVLATGVAGAALMGTGWTASGIAALGLAAVLAAAWTTLRYGVHRRRARARREIRQALRGVPDGDAITPDARPRHMARYRAQMAARKRRGMARDRLAAALRSGRAALRASRERNPEPGDGGSESMPDDPVSATEGLRSRLKAEAERVRERLTRDQVELDMVGDITLDLPHDVPPTEDAVTGALQSRREARTEAQRSMQELGQELLEWGTPAESVEALEALLHSTERRRADLERKAAVLEAAHSLLTDAYGAFRDRDQVRLVSLVSERVEQLAGEAMGPLLADDGLEDARIRTRGRLVPLRSPPLSFGEYHTVLLGVRLGTADFLGSIGVQPPLVIDEPFAHLDVKRARAVWSLLERVAQERQVVITAQDALLISELGIEPDIILDR
jgi:recombinational DNA repair ATPase RecF